MLLITIVEMSTLRNGFEPVPVPNVSEISLSLYLSVLLPWDNTARRLD